MGLTSEELREMRAMQRQQELAKTPAGRIALELVERRKEAQRNRERVLEQFEQQTKTPEPIITKETSPIEEKLKEWGYIQ